MGNQEVRSGVPGLTAVETKKVLFSLLARYSLTGIDAMPGRRDMDSTFQRLVIVCILAAIAVWCGPVTAQSSGSLTISGDELVDQGKFAEAITFYDQAIALEPRNAVALCGKGVALNALGNYSEALTVLDQAIAISPAYAKAWYEKGNALNGLGRYDEAIAAYDKALEIKPEYGYLAYYGKANALAGLGNYTEAIPLYDKALSLEPRYAIAWVKLGDARAATGDYQGAVAAYDEALLIEPDYTAAKNARDAAEAQLSGTGTLITTPAQPARTTGPLTTTEETTRSTTPTSRGVPLPLWICGAGIITSAYLARKRG
jgi:Flp pilus assembly protein TadD